MKKIFLSLVFAMVNIISFTSCSKDDELTNEHLVDPVLSEYTENDFIDSISINVSSNTVSVYFAHPYVYISKYVCHILVSNDNGSSSYFFDKVNSFNEPKFGQNNQYIEEFDLPMQINYNKKYMVDIVLTDIEYGVINNDLRTIRINKEIYIEAPEPEHNTYFNLNGETNTIIECNVSNISISYDTDYEVENIEIYVNDKLYEQNDGVININCGYNYTDNDVTNKVIIKYKDTEVHTIEITITQKKFDINCFFNNESFKVTGNYSSISIPGYSHATGNFVLMNCSKYNVKLIKCEVYVNGNLYNTLTFNNDMFNSGDSFTIYEFSSSNVPTVTTKLTFEFNGKEYTF